MTATSERAPASAAGTDPATRDGLGLAVLPAVTEPVLARVAERAGEVDRAEADLWDELAALGEREFDVIVLDVFSGQDSPAHLAEAGFYRETLARLGADGLLMVNVGDDAGQLFLSAQVRELEAAAAVVGVPGVWTLTDAQLLSRPADGNMVLLAGGALASPAVEDWRAAWLAAGPHPAAVLDPHETQELVESINRS